MAMWTRFEGGGIEPLGTDPIDTFARDRDGNAEDLDGRVRGVDGVGCPEDPGEKRARLGTVAAMDNTKTDRTVDGRPNAIEHAHNKRSPREKNRSERDGAPATVHSSRQVLKGPRSERILPKPMPPRN